MPQSTSPQMRALVAILATVALIACLLAGYLAWLQWRASGAAGLVMPGLSAIPVPEKEPEITLTPKEAAELEGQLQKAILQIMAGGCKIDKITKDGHGAVMSFQTSDALLRVHLDPKPPQDQDQKH